MRRPRASLVREPAPAGRLGARFSSMLRPALGAAMLAALASMQATSAGCGRPCRSVAVQAIDVECETGSVWEGELHLDDAAVFESWLSQECLPSSSPEQVGALVDSVDFLNDAVFVAAGRRMVQSRCIESREAADVAVCDDGLRVSFDDKLSGSVDCLGRWTVVFALAREDLRAALGE